MPDVVVGNIVEYTVIRHKDTRRLASLLAPHVANTSSAWVIGSNEIPNCRKQHINNYIYTKAILHLVLALNLIGVLFVWQHTIILDGITVCPSYYVKLSYVPGKVVHAKQQLFLFKSSCTSLTIIGQGIQPQPFQDTSGEALSVSKGNYFEQVEQPWETSLQGTDHLFILCTLKKLRLRAHCHWPRQPA